MFDINAQTFCSITVFVQYYLFEAEAKDIQQREREKENGIEHTFKAQKMSWSEAPLENILNRSQNVAYGSKLESDFGYAKRKQTFICSIAQTMFDFFDRLWSIWFHAETCFTFNGLYK